jgi:cytochrome c553
MAAFAASTMLPPAGAQPAAPGAGVSSRLAVCAACHGADGNSQLANSPSLAAQPRVFLEHQLIVIREGLRVIPVMQGLLDGVTDQEISALAKHFAEQPLKSQPGSRDDARFERGRVLASSRHCASCHLAAYEGREQMPRLAGQREDYLVHSMRDFKSGNAVGRDTLMASALFGLTDQDLQDLGHYLAHLK